MAKKPRSQRRKKGKSLGDDTDDSAVVSLANQEVLSETHTVADESVSTLGGGYWDEDEDSLENENFEANVDDLLSTGSSGNSQRRQGMMAVRHQRLMDSLLIIGELPTEKRSAKREATLRKLFRALTQYAAGTAGREAVEHHEGEIRAACVYSIRAGAPAEQYAACRVLESTSVILGADQDDFYESIQTHLQRCVMTHVRATPVRIAALRAMAMSNLIGSTDQQSTQLLLDLCEEVAAPVYRNQTVPDALRATAWDCWALLGTTTEDFDLAGNTETTMGRGLTILRQLKECLDSSNVDLRAAAGECVALIHEARLNLGMTLDESEAANATERRFRRGSWDGSEWEVLMDEIKQRIGELSVESGHRMSKKAKKEQRATFREFHSTIVDDESPEEVVTFRGGTLTLNSWREIVQLNFIRHCLQGGFQIQLMTNETLQAVFGADGRVLNEFSTMSQIEKRLHMSKGSEAAKQAHIDMTKKRRSRANAKNHFLTVDGEGL